MQAEAHTTTLCMPGLEASVSMLFCECICLCVFSHVGLYLTLFTPLCTEINQPSIPIWIHLQRWIIFCMWSLQYGAHVLAVVITGTIFALAYDMMMKFLENLVLLLGHIQCDISRLFYNGSYLCLLGLQWNWSFPLIKFTATQLNMHTHMCVIVIHW